MRHFFHPASEGPVKAQRRKTKLSTLSIREILRQAESVDYQLRNRLFLQDAQVRGLRKRELDLDAELTERILEAQYKAEQKALRNPLGVDEALLSFLIDERNPARKALCKAPNRGYKRSKPPSPTGKTIGAFRVVRQKGSDSLSHTGRTRKESKLESTRHNYYKKK